MTYADGFWFGLGLIGALTVWFIGFLVVYSILIASKNR